MNEPERLLTPAEQVAFNLCNQNPTLAAHYTELLNVVERAIQTPVTVGRSGFEHVTLISFLRDHDVECSISEASELLRNARDALGIKPVPRTSWSETINSESIALSDNVKAEIEVIKQACKNGYIKVQLEHASKAAHPASGQMLSKKELKAVENVETPRDFEEHWSFSFKYLAQAVKANKQELNEAVILARWMIQSCGIEEEKALQYINNMVNLLDAQYKANQSQATVSI